MSDETMPGERLIKQVARETGIHPILGEGTNCTTCGEWTPDPGVCSLCSNATKPDPPTVFDADTWPKDGGRYVCTSARPMPAKRPKRSQWAHPEAVDAGGCYEGCCDDYMCPACGLEWRIEHGA